ncbi:hypothetical protein [Sneathiella limimaris]|uniref:hypothetical protein n=1 Tax=Sneathiella limimaris TaxID=1964213 RepID=UPI00146AE7BD|nr:hypothetical protein [Sneathiella limimaris]
MKFRILAACTVGVGLLLSSLPAHAAPVSFLTGEGTKDGDSYKFSGGGVDITATSWSSSGQPSIQQYLGGLGVTSCPVIAELFVTNQECIDDSVDVEGYGNWEAILLSFSVPVYITKLLFTDVGENDHFSYRINDVSSSTEVDIQGTGDNGFHEFSLPGLLVSSVYIGELDQQEGFKLRGIELVSAVPLPPAFALFAAPLLLLGWIRRRR